MLHGIDSRSVSYLRQFYPEAFRGCGWFSLYSRPFAV